MLLTSAQRKDRDEYFEKYRNDPLRWIHDYIPLKDGLWEKQEEIISSVFEHTYTAVRSGHSIGKTFASALCVLAFLCTQIPSKVITTAPTFKQVEKILWRDVRRLWQMRKSGGPKGITGRLLNIELKLDEDWFALGLHPAEYDVEAFQGFHSENILIILDESPGIGEELYGACDSLMSSDNAHLLQIGNPTISAGHFFNAFKEKSIYNTLHVSCLDSPNLMGKGTVRPYLVTQKWVDDMRTKWGEKSDFWITKVLGNFPSGEETSFAPLEWIEQAMEGG